MQHPISMLDFIAVRLKLPAITERCGAPNLVSLLLPFLLGYTRVLSYHDFAPSSFIRTITLDGFSCDSGDVDGSEGSSEEK